MLGVGEHLCCQRLVDTEERAETSAEQCGRDHRHGEVGDDCDADSRGTLRHACGEDERLSSPDNVAQLARHQRTDDDEHHVDRCHQQDVVVGVGGVDAELQKEEEQRSAKGITKIHQHAAK